MEEEEARGPWAASWPASVNVQPMQDGAQQPLGVKGEGMGKEGVNDGEQEVVRHANVHKSPMVVVECLPW